MYKIQPEHLLFEHDQQKMIEGIGELKAVEIGAIDFSTGEVIACDPFMFMDKPLVKRVPVGKHTVLLNIIRFENADERVAYGILQCSKNAIVSWEMALQPNEDTSNLGDDEFYGYGVDTGTGGFMDQAVCERLKIYEVERYRQDNDFNLYDEIEEEFDANYVPTHQSLVKEFEGIGSVALFSSGYGDGVYPSFWGFDADGEVVCLVTDFLLTGE